MAAALAACVGSNAYALGFGRMRVQSALGQPLRAEVELIDAQAANLKAGMASPALYTQKGLEYVSAVKGIRSSTRQMPNGQMVLVLTSDAPINEPFIDVVLQASDGAGSVTRDFSILLDPPAASRAPVAVVEPLTPRTATVSPAAPVVTERIERSPVESDRKTSVRSGAVATKKTPRALAGSVRVRQGDTAGQIAAVNRPAHVSLDQMLVALQRANSHAFINGNVHHLKSGAVLRMPSASEAQAIPAAEARTVIIAQSEDFRAYRNRLARSPMAQTTPSPQQSGGKVQSKVEDTRTSAAVAPDTLTISKADVKGGKTAEQRMAETMQKKDNANRAEELNRNLSDLKNISAEATASAQQAGQVASGTGPVIVAPSGAASSAIAVTAASAAAQAASQMEEAASAAAGAASEAASAAAGTVSAAASAAAPRKKPAKHQPLPPEAGFLESLLGSSAFMGGMGLSAVGGLVYVFLRQRRKNQGGGDTDTSFQESNYTPDSFFHASGGKDVDTSESTAAGSGSSGMNQSSMLYSPSQLDAEADVDPVSEADVYLAYGRDIQAEEILKDALFKHPGRLPIYVKLLEIYARRRDVKAYAQYATELKQLTHGKGPEWDVACAKGAEIDPGHPLYAACATVAAAAAPVPEIGSAATATSADSVYAGAAGAMASGAGSQVVDNDPAQLPTVRTDLLQQPTMSPMTVPVTENAQVAKGDPSAMSPIDLTLDMPEEELFSIDAAQESEADRNPDFDLSGLSPATVPVVSSLSTYSLPEPVIDLTLDMPDEPSPSISTPSTSQAIGDGLDFDMSGLSLDLGQPRAPETGTFDSMATKLALAREFLAIGDNEGARVMAQEVAQKANGELKAQAEALLASIL